MRARLQFFTQNTDDETPAAQRNEKLTENHPIPTSMVKSMTLQMSFCFPRHHPSWQLPWAVLCDTLHRTKV